MKIPLYDEKCLDLARYFYPDMPEEKLSELAALIQVTIEDFAPHTEEENGDAASGPRNGLSSKPFAWGDVFNRHLAKGEDHGSAAHAADQAEKRAKKLRAAVVANT